MQMLLFRLNTLAKKKMATAQAAGSTVEEKDKSTV